MTSSIRSIIRNMCSDSVRANRAAKLAPIFAKLLPKVANPPALKAAWLARRQRDYRAKNWKATV